MTHDNLYNLIIHNDPECWRNDQRYVDFPKERFLEYTEENIKNQFQSLNQDTITKIKRLPTLFAVEEEKAETRIGRVTNVKIQSESLQICFKFDNEYSPLTKGALNSPELGLNIDELELYKTHWAIKDADLSDFLEKRSKSLEGVLDRIKKELDAPLKEKTIKKVSTLYACNSSGKTRLSKLFCDLFKEGDILCYNAFIEDLFSWDNDRYVLNIDARAWIFQIIQDEGIDRKIIDNFQDFTDSRLEPVFDILNGIIMFQFPGNPNNIKISRGEESVFVWSVFYTILDVAIEVLNQTADERSTEVFNTTQYVVIDDPVSSMDDTRIITIALALAELITKPMNKLKFLITTHHALFFNILFNARNKHWDKKWYLLSKSDTGIHLKIQNNDSPFAYHHVIIFEIEQAIDNKNIKKYHFNLFRALLEKTANFLRYSGGEGWKKLLSEKDHGKTFIKTLDHYSHDRLSDLDPKDLSEDNKEIFERAFNFFLQEFKWDKSNDG